MTKWAQCLRKAGEERAAWAGGFLLPDGTEDVAGEKRGNLRRACLPEELPEFVVIVRRHVVLV
jgi:hypothetical protein